MNFEVLSGRVRKIVRLTIIIIIASLVFTSVSPVFAQEEGGVEEQQPVPSEPITAPEPDDNKFDFKNKNEESNLESDKGEQEELEPSNNQESQSLMSSEEEGEAAPLPKIQELKSINADEVSGALVYDYPISVPPGRNKLQPKLYLSYNSQKAYEEGSVFGSGWDISIPYIERINKNGTDKLYSENYFNSSINGELIQVGGGTYGPKIENGEFLKYNFVNNNWTVADKSGTVFKFGYSVNSRQDNPSDSTKVFRWMLEEVRDTNNNFVKYEYYKNSGQIYPSKIIYTGSGSTDGIYEVEFVRESRADIIASNKAAFSVITNSRIKEILCKTNSALHRKYLISYTSGNNDSRSMIGSVIESGIENGVTITKDPITFDYQSPSKSWVEDQNWDFPVHHLNEENQPIVVPFQTQSGSPYNVQIADVNGDGLNDLVESKRTQKWSVPAQNFVKESKTAVYLNNGSTWVLDPNWIFPIEEYNLENNPLYYVFEYENGRINYGLKLVDINGDGLSDLVNARQSTKWSQSLQQSVDISITQIFINTGTGWVEDSNWIFPTDYMNAENEPVSVAFERQGRATDLQIVDVNGDMLPDLIRSRWTTQWSEALQQIVTVSLSNVYLHNGSGWVEDQNWDFPVHHLNEENQPIVVPFQTQSGSPYNVQIADVNGDGLNDLVESKVNNRWSIPLQNFVKESRSKVYLNNGSTWVEDPNWIFPVYYLNQENNPVYYPFEYENGRANYGLKLSDVNGDGLSDLVYSYEGFELSQTSQQPINVSKTHVFLNIGTGWVEDPNWVFPTNYLNAENDPVAVGFERLGAATDLQIVDVNGDMLPDLIRSRWTTEWSQALQQIITVSKSNVYLHEGNNADLLQTIEYDTDGDTEITYKSSAQYVASGNRLNPLLPNVILAVESITQNDGLGLASNQEFTYEGGSLYYGNIFDRRFAGFNKITKKIVGGNKKIIYNHQGNTSNTSLGEYSDHAAKIGRPYRVEIQDISGNAYSKTINKWENVDLGNGRNFVKNTQTIQMDYDGNSSHKDKVTTTSYNNANGNITQQVEWGEVTGSDNGTFTDVGSDKFTTDITYATGSTVGVTGLPSTETTINQSAAKVKETRHYYDTLALGSVQKGNETKTESWKSGSSYINTQKTYNSYGLVTQETDPRGKTTTYTYDSYNLYPATVTNHLNQQTQYLYDYSIGKPKQVTDANGKIFQTVFDGLDRVVAEKQPDLTTPATLVNKTSYTYENLPVGEKVTKLDHLSPTNSIETVAYTDGLGRVIQERQETEDANTYAVKDLAYNNRGLLEKESLPYFSTGSAKTSPTTTTNLYSTYSYDPLERVTSVATAVGNTANSYDDWKTVITDPNGKIKRLFKDAAGNLVKVEEVNGASTYTTLYEYNYLGNLIKITDALNNVRNFTYDGLSRRLTAEDLHASADATFGTWTYGYDDAGNLTSSVDPKAQTINYTYDDLNRKLTENFTGQAGTEVTYAYDTCPNGVGRLCSTTSAAATDAKEYNPAGGVKKETRTIDAVNYITQYDYDYQGNETLVTYPDNSQVKNTYNNGGLLETVQRKESGDANFANLVTDFDYNPMGKITNQSHSNGVNTVSTYDAAKLYRLSNKTTTRPGGSKAQDLSYTYDNNGNVTKIVDNSNTNTKKTVDYTYDDLNRLLSATTSNAVNGQNYTESYTYDALGNITNKPGAGAYTYAGNSGSNYANPHAVTSITGTGSGTVNTELLASPWTLTGNNGSDEKYQTVPSNILNGKTSITVTYDLNGICALGGDASAIIFDQNGWKYVSLSNYGQNCYDGQQVVTIPLSAFTGLNTNANLTGSLHSRFWYGSAFNVEITSIKINAPATETTNYGYDNNGNLTSISAQSSSIPWYSGSGTWTDRKQITVDETKIPGSTALTDFPFLFKTTDPDLRTVANGGKVGKSDGTDILVTQNNTSKLDHEIEKYDPATGELVVWVRIPSLSASANTTLYAYFGNASAADQQNKVGVWSTNYKGVWHLNNSLNDSTSNAKNLTNVGSANGTGLLGSGRTFNGSSQAAYTSSLPTTVTNNFTISAWIKPNSTTGEQIVMSNGSDPGSGSGGGYSIESSNGTWKGLYNMVYRHDTASSVSTSDWTHIAVVRDNGVSRVYKNGAQVGTTFSNTPNAPVNTFTLGAQAKNATPDLWRYFNGSTDEARVISATRSADWLAAEYNNQGSPATFYSYGPVVGSGAMMGWDYNNRMTSFTKSGVAASYTYDDAGARIKNTVGGSTTVYPNRLYNIAGTKKTKHIFANGQMVATVETNGSTTTVYQDHTDHLTGSNTITDSTGAIVQTLDYYPYGSIRLDEKSGSFNEQRKYAGHEYDVDTQLSYMNARYYSGNTGRFASQDPVFLAVGDNGLIKALTQNELQLILSDPQNLNAYAYGRNNPLSYNDPTGQWSINVFAVLPNSWQVGIGNAANNAYNNNAVARYALDHPYQAGAAIGLLGGAAVAGGVVAAGGSITCGILCGTAAVTTATSTSTACASGGCQKVADNAPKVANGLQLGQRIQNLGTVIENGPGKITGFNHDGTYHGLDQIITRGVSPQALQSTVQNPLVRFAGRFDRVGYLSKDAYVVLDKAGQVVTSWTSNEFGTTIKNVLSSIKQ